MSDNLSKVMDKIKKSKKSPEKEEEIEEEIEEDDEEQEESEEEDLEADDEEEEDDEDEEEEEAEEEKPIKKPVKKVKKADTNIKKIKKVDEKPLNEEKQLTDEEIHEQRAKEVEMLQNDGVFRAELLYQLSQINQNLLILNAMINKVVKGDEDGERK